ncbi:MAG: TetR/AcrR family transcriptional regulator [Bacteroidota bacterium]
MKRSSRNAARTKQEIIAKSAPVFNVHGYAGTKMQMLVDATGFQMGGIYRHFETKMDLAKAVFQYTYEHQVMPNLQVEETLNPKEKILAILENYKQMIIKPKIAGGCPLLNSSTEVDDTDEAFRQLTQDSVDQVLGIMEGILEEGKTSGHILPGIDSQKEAEFIFATVEGTIMLRSLKRSRKPMFNIFDKIEEYFKEKVFVGEK